MVGIVSSRYLTINLIFSLLLLFASLSVLLNFSFSKMYRQYQLNWAKGAAIQLLFFSLGQIIFLLNHYENKEAVNAINSDKKIAIVRLEEPPVQKQNSWKVTASFQYISGKENRGLKGTLILLRFPKDSTISKLKYGSFILFKAALREIKNTGNPGSFDLKSYCSFQHIYSEVFLEQRDWKLSDIKDTHPVKEWLFRLRQKIINVLKKYINGEKEKGLAEALLIGFREDLDKDLIQSYSHTGVVHIIAISGLHLALIYALLQLAFQWLPDRRYGRWLKPLVLISSLWIFSFLCGGSPSVLRSAMMFSFLIVGKMGSKKTSIYNSLALSAFFLLCIEPAWLWDAGFQLSFGAVLSIVVFMRPIYHALHFQNKI
ncbi:MAG TPA: ComEC/Rec2 family competence protein, partial [Puia sp.]|nr:ComEC/Rec2 family competence protein [Puia sp.]